jgi:Na+/proline symporter
MLMSEDGKAQNPANPYTAILEEVMNLRGFAYFAGVIAVTASLAAIMSTADSLIIAISQLITVEIIYPLTPQGSPTQVTWCGRFVSLLSVLIALCIG